MPLTDVPIRALKPLAAAYKRSDSGGLYLEISPSGGKLWRFKYRYLGSEKRMALGRYPDVTLVNARKRRDELRRQLEGGLDPGAERAKQKLLATLSADNTFAAIAAEYVEQKLSAEGKAQVTVDKARWLIEQLQPIGKRPIEDLKPIDVLAALKRIEAKGKYETARRCRSFASRVFRYAVATARAENDPASVLAGALITPKVRHHAALIEPTAVGELLRAIDAFSGSPVVRYAMQIAPHVMARPGELRQANWEEFDLAAAIWKIPASRMKQRRPHAVPLSRQVVSLLREIEPLTGPKGYVFPALHTSRRPMSENTMNQAFRRMGFSSDEVTAHGLRTTASTLLNESNKWNPDAIERSLAHGDSDAVRGTYNRGRYWIERVEMHQWWSDYLDQLRATPRNQMAA